MYLIDTDVVSNVRKRDKADPGVTAFFRQATAEDASLYLSAITVGELGRGVELIRQRGDRDQANTLDRWLKFVLAEYADNILSIDAEIAQVWGRLRVPRPESPLDKQIAATALIHDLTLVTRNVRHFESLGVRLINPFSG